MRESKQMRAYHDTWTPCVRSHLRNRLSVAPELLMDNGSIFVQISDKNQHSAWIVMEEV